MRSAPCSRLVPSQIKFPPYVTPAAKDFVLRLLERKPTKRLGMLQVHTPLVSATERAGAVGPWAIGGVGRAQGLVLWAFSHLGVGMAGLLAPGSCRK